MTNYEKIKFLLEMGVYKGVEVIIETGNGNYRYTFIHFSGDLIYDDRRSPHNKVIINRHNITSITPIPNPPKLLPVGTKVRVFEEYGLKDKIYSVAYIKKIETGMEKEISFDVGYVLVGGHEIPARAVVPVL